MNVDFDKEIDALLRKTRRDSPVLVGDIAAAHLDADEIAAFAENALPEKSRGAYTLHLAECDRCRKILSNLLVMSTAAAPAAASPGVITIAERNMPWYRKLYLFPNLAYVMGGLMLIFGGFLAFTVIQRSGMNSAEISQATIESESRRGGPNFQSEPSIVDPNAMANTNAAANVATGSAPMMSNANLSTRPAESGVAGPRSGDNNFVIDGTSTTDTLAPAAPPAGLAMQPATKDEAQTKPKVEEKEKVAVTNAPVSEATKNDAMLKAQSGANVPTQSGPMRNNELNYQRQLENLDRRRVQAEAKKSATRDEEASGRRALGGRTFERKQGVWYDVNYQGRPTINVRRGTAEFERLDGGLKSIANSLSGTIVVVWGAKAYRIQ